MRTLKGPGGFPARSDGDAPPFGRSASIASRSPDVRSAVSPLAAFAASHIDIARAASPPTHRDALTGTATGVEVTELGADLQGPLDPTPPACDALVGGFAPPEVRGAMEPRRASPDRPARRAVDPSAPLDHAQPGGMVAGHPIARGDERPDGGVVARSDRTPTHPQSGGRGGAAFARHRLSGLGR